MIFPRYGRNRLVVIVVSMLAAFLFSGCTYFNNSGQTTETEDLMPENAPYYPTGVNDIQIPGELSLRRDTSMYINTASFAGGIMNFEGRVEINSLTDFFISTMQKNDWKLAGSVRYKNVLLAFVKPNKTCMVNIYDASIGLKTQVYIYITEDIIGKGSHYMTREESLK